VSRGEETSTYSLHAPLDRGVPAAMSASFFVAIFFLGHHRDACVLRLRTRNLCCRLSEPVVVARVRVSDNFARIPARGETPPNELIDAKLFRTTDFDDAVYRRPVAALATALATSSVAIGWKSTCGKRTALPSVEKSAMPLRNS
jgi:hypothetical protein